MCSDLVDLMRRTIDEEYVLKRQGKSWIFQEIRQDTQEVVYEQKIRSPDRNSFAFSLDCPDPKPLAFFSSSPPLGVACMCDAIMVCSYKQRSYLFLIEVKTGNRGNYRDQLRNGRIFCDWLLRLYEEHDHPYVRPTFIALLIWSPREDVPERLSTVSNSEDDSGIPGITRMEVEKRDFDYGFDIKNRASVPIVELCHLCESGMNSK